MDVTSVVAGHTAARNEATATAAQVSLLKKALVTESAVAAKLLAPMDLPLATEGRVGTNLNTYI